MEHLSNIIEALFAYQDGDQILKYAHLLKDDNDSNKKSKEPKYLYKETPESTIINLLQKAKIYNTIDQQLIIAQVFQSKWSEPDYSLQTLEFTKYSTVFNALLHFANESIYIKDNDPICKYHRLLRWHLLTSLLGEDIFTTSYLASHDVILNNKRNFFGWDVILGHDNKEINNILSKPIADVHMHLKGSSFNFDISWISIMNNFMKLQGKFEELTNEYKDSFDWDTDIYDKIRRCAIIRYYLACTVNLVSDTFTTAELDFVLNYKDIDKTKELLENKYHQKIIDYNTIQTRILQINEKLRKSYGEKLIISHEYIPIVIETESRGEKKISNILSSERKLLYLCFYKIFIDSNDIFADLFYAYLSYKSYFRQKILQLNDQVGFKNFAKYEERKDIFILPIYKRLLYKAAVCNFLEKDCNRFLETRITPKNTSDEIRKSLAQIVDAVRSDTENNTIPDRLGIIFHFIKKRDNRGKDETGYRHEKLLKQIKEQCFSICKFRSDPKDWNKDPLVGLVVGIDAANSEIMCRPEVFGQAYRFLRSYSSNNWDDFNHPNDLNFTFHVGEDFLDIADGLRAIEEAIIFLGLKHGDRIGHGLVLGTDILKYYEKRYFTVCASKQVLLDNAVWLYHKCQRLNGSIKLMEYFECVFQKYFNEVYCNNSMINRESYYDFLEGKTKTLDEKQDNNDFYDYIRNLNNINDYYLSWLLRGNHPTFGADIVMVQKNKNLDNMEKQWIESSINHHPSSKMAMYNPNARELFDAYHRRDITKRGDEGDTLYIPESLRADFISLLINIQEQLLSKLEKKRIGIECNPTSNYKIGEIERYDEHPIFKFYNFGLNTPFKRHDIFVSINTDDLGVFSTSLDREYSLIALAAERAFCKNEMNTPKQILEWINNIRKMSIEQLFINRKTNKGI